MSSNKMENIGIIIDILTHEDDIFCEKAEIVLEQMMALHKAGSSKEIGDDGAYEMKPFTGKEDFNNGYGQDDEAAGTYDEGAAGEDDEDEEDEDMSKYSRYFGKRGEDDDDAPRKRPVMTVQGEEPEEPAEAQGSDGYYENGDYEPRRGNRRVQRPAASDDDDDHYEPGMNRRRMTVSGEENAKPTTVPSVQGPADEANGDYEAKGTIEHESSVPSAYPPGIQAQVDALQRAIAYGYGRAKVQMVRDRLTKLSTDAFDNGDITERQLELLLNM